MVFYQNIHYSSLKRIDILGIRNDHIWKLYKVNLDPILHLLIINKTLAFA